MDIEKFFHAVLQFGLGGACLAWVAYSLLPRIQNDNKEIVQKISDDHKSALAEISDNSRTAIERLGVEHQATIRVLVDECREEKRELVQAIERARAPQQPL